MTMSFVRSVKSEGTDMGYRSDVAYTIRFTHDNVERRARSFATFLAEVRSRDEFATALEQVKIDDGECKINFLAKGCKWYESFPDVQSHLALVRTAQEWCDNMYGLVDPLHHLGVIFVRVGENCDDVEEIASGHYMWDWVHSNRTIESDFNDDFSE
jgi:hypothetical protein